MKLSKFIYFLVAASEVAKTVAEEIRNKAKAQDINLEANKPNAHIFGTESV